MNRENDAFFEKYYNALQQYYYGWGLKAVQSLEGRNDSRVFDALLVALEHGYHEVQIAAIQLLAKQDNPLTFDAICSVLEDANADVRNAAIEALAKFGTKALLPIINLLDNEDENVQETAAEVFTTMGAEAIIPFAENWGDSTTFPRKFGIVMVLSEIPDIKVIAPLLKILQDESEDQEVRFEAAYGLGQFADDNVINILEALFRNATQNIQVRQGVLKALGRTATESGFNLITGALSDESEDIRSIAIFSLRYFRVEEVEEYMVTALNDSSAEVRRLAARVVENLKIESALEPLLKLFEVESNVKVLRQIMAAIAKIADTSVIAPLIEILLTTDNKWLVAEFAQAFGKLEDNSVVEPFIQAVMRKVPIDDSDRLAIGKALRNYPDEAVTLLIPLLNHPNEKWGIQAALALSKIADKKAASALLPTLHVKSRDVHLHTIFALGEIGTQKELVVLQDYLQELSSSPDENSNDIDWTEQAIDKIKAREAIF